MTAMSSNSSGWLTSSRPGVLGPRSTPASMNRGMVGRPNRRPRRPNTKAARKAPPSAMSVWATAQWMNWSRKPGRSSGRPTTTSWSPGRTSSSGSGATIDWSPRTMAATVMRLRCADLGLGDGASGHGRGLADRHPVDEQAADDRLDPLRRRRREVGPGDDGAETAGQVVVDRQHLGVPVRFGEVEVPPAGVVDDHADLPVVGQGEGEPAPDAGEVVLLNLTFFCHGPLKARRASGPLSGGTAGQALEHRQVR